MPFSGPHFRLPRFDSPLTTPSEVKINDRRILPVINYYIKTLYSLNVYTQVYTLLSKILFICRNKIVLCFFHIILRHFKGKLVFNHCQLLISINVSSKIKNLCVCVCVCVCLHTSISMKDHYF